MITQKTTSGALKNKDVDFLDSTQKFLLTSHTSIFDTYEDLSGEDTVDGNNEDIPLPWEKNKRGLSVITKLENVNFHVTQGDSSGSAAVKKSTKGWLLLLVLMMRHRA